MPNDNLKKLMINDAELYANKSTSEIIDNIKGLLSQNEFKGKAWYSKLWSFITNESTPNAIKNLTKTAWYTTVLGNTAFIIYLLVKYGSRVGGKVDDKLNNLIPAATTNTPTAPSTTTPTTVPQQTSPTEKKPKPY